RQKDRERGKRHATTGAGAGDDMAEDLSVRPQRYERAEPEVPEYLTGCAESLEEVGLLGSRARLRLGVAIGQVKQCVDVAEVAVALPAFRQLHLSRELHVFPRCGRHPKDL